MRVRLVNVSLFFCFLALIVELKAQDETEFYGAARCGYQRADDSIKLEDSITRTAAIDEFPWTVALIYKHKYQEKEGILCNGALINSKHVLTIAQCVRSPKKTKIDRVRFGEYNISRVQECINEDYGSECVDVIDKNISEIIVHEDYKEDTRENDIAILRLDDSLQFSDYRRPICLARQNSPALRQGNIVFISGWGRTSLTGPQSEVKKKVMSELITNLECGKEFTGRNVGNTHFCSTDLTSNVVFSSVGDAGAPVMSRCGNNRWCLLGLFSWTANQESKPRVHTRVSEYMDWITVNANFAT